MIHKQQMEYPSIRNCPYSGYDIYFKIKSVTQKHFRIFLIPIENKTRYYSDYSPVEIDAAVKSGLDDRPAAISHVTRD